MYPIIKPSILQKITTIYGHYKTHKNLVLEIWEIYLKNINQLMSSNNVKEGLRLLYEYKHEKYINKIEEELKEKQKNVKKKDDKQNQIEKKAKRIEDEYRILLKIEKVNNPLAYSLIHKKFGYVLNSLCRVMNPDESIKLIKTYELPINIVSVESCYQLEDIFYTNVMNSDYEKSFYIYYKYHIDSAEYRLLL